ncbi:MAG: hypothetical protein NC037_06565 [Bacteroides sp.]|nr:hypothetical protein [Bacillota bacterium]MCM1393525.1 hypothetical protein [[Eubacterium] siraeum]MCM1456167.1 hypothetical protein [Bacteroides sp.]
MDYDKVIIDMLNRICILEEQVKKLSEEKRENIMKTSTLDVKNYIIEFKQAAKEKGHKYIDLISNDIHNALKLKSRMPIVCNAMKQAMNDGDIIIHQTASGYSSTLTIRYFLEV